MSFIPRVHEIYKHFKGDLYQITAIAEHTETGETLVIYQAMYGEFKTYARPLEMFVGPVDKGKYPDAAQEYRFELQGPEADRQRRECGVDLKNAEAKNAEIVEEESGADEQEDMPLDPLVIQFLDAETYAERLGILAALEHRITDDMLTTMAISCDVEVEEGDIEQRVASLRNCLMTFERYEGTRLR